MGNQELNTENLSDEFIPTSEFLSLIIDSLQDYSIFTTDKHLRINSWNAGSTKIFGYEADEVMNKHCELIFTQEDRENEIPMKNIDIALKEGKIADSRWHVRKDGSKFFAYGLIFPLRRSNGELIGFVKVMRDLTEKKKSEETIKKYISELEEINTHKDAILAILSHDLRSPLAAIIQMTELLKNNFNSMKVDELRRMLETLYDLSNKELSMLDYLLEWARIKLASEAFSPRQIELAPYVHKIFDTLQEVAAQNTIQLMPEIEEGTSIFADEKMLLSILQNLVSNAIKYSYPGGQVTVTASQKDDMIEVQVKDTGEGMDQSILQKLFTPQVKTLSKTRKKNKGGGIGLLLAKGFVERNGGEIWVESEEGKGTSFYFSLPIENPSDKMDKADTLIFEES